MRDDKEKSKNFLGTADERRNTQNLTRVERIEKRAFLWPILFLIRLWTDPDNPVHPVWQNLQPLVGELRKRETRPSISADCLFNISLRDMKSITHP